MGKRRVVIALGGNALGNNIREQKQKVAETAKVIADLAEQGMELVITHGNGPQVGLIQTAMDNMLTGNCEDRFPLATSVAMSQGYIGIDLEHAIKHELCSRNIDRKVSTVFTQVEVDPNDTAFQNPSKPIGRFMTEKEAKEAALKGFACIEDAGRGYRIVVPSPMPKRIKELETIKMLLNSGHIVITCGGGGIPVIQSEKGERVSINAVIDKDIVSSLLAKEIEADLLVILTAVERVAIHFGKIDQKWLTELTVEEAKHFIEQGEFAKGSMLPKIEAAVHFAESAPKRYALITLLEKASAGLSGETGTLIHM